MKRLFPPSIFLLLLFCLLPAGLTAESAKSLYAKGVDAQARQDYERLMSSSGKPTSCNPRI